MYIHMQSYVWGSMYVCTNAYNALITSTCLSGVLDCDNKKYEAQILGDHHPTASESIHGVQMRLRGSGFWGFGFVYLMGIFFFFNCRPGLGVSRDMVSGRRMVSVTGGRLVLWRLVCYDDYCVE